MTETYDTGVTSTDVDLQDIAAGLAVPGAEDGAAPDLPIEGATDPGLTDASPSADDLETAERFFVDVLDFAPVERMVASPFETAQSLMLNLNSPDFTNATRLTAAINASFGAGTASGALILSVK